MRKLGENLFELGLHPSSIKSYTQGTNKRTYWLLEGGRFRESLYPMIRRHRKPWWCQVHHLWGCSPDFNPVLDGQYQIHYCDEGKSKKEPQGSSNFTKEWFKWISKFLNIDALGHWLCLKIWPTPENDCNSPRRLYCPCGDFHQKICLN